MVRIRIRLQVNSDISDKLAMWLSRDYIVNTFPIRGPGTVECTRRASLGDGEECVDEGKLVVTRKPQKRGLGGTIVSRRLSLVALPPMLHT